MLMMGLLQVWDLMDIDDLSLAPICKPGLMLGVAWTFWFWSGYLPPPVVDSGSWPRMSPALCVDVGCQI